MARSVFGGLDSNAKLIFLALQGGAYFIDLLGAYKISRTKVQLSIEKVKFKKNYNEKVKFKRTYK